MSLLVQEINEIRSFLKRKTTEVNRKEGDLKHDDIQDLIALYSQVHKREASLIQAYALQLKNKKIMQQLIDSNLVSDHIAINLSVEEKENQTIRCTYNDRLIPLSACLDISGENKEGMCNGCPHFKTSRDKLL